MSRITPPCVMHQTSTDIEQRRGLTYANCLLAAGCISNGEAIRRGAASPAEVSFSRRDYKPENQNLPAKQAAAA